MALFYYIRGNKYIIPIIFMKHLLLLKIIFAGLLSTLVYVVVSGEEDPYESIQYFYHTDHLGTTSYITDLSGEVYQHIEYFPFGGVMEEERNGSAENNYLFNGKELDEESGLYYYGARYYDPIISMWLGVDPMAQRRAWASPYNYCQNNPIGRVDVDGRMDEAESGAYIGYTESTGKKGNKGYPTLYFEKGHLTQAYRRSTNIGWHPTHSTLTLSRNNITKIEAKAYKDNGYSKMKQDNFTPASFIREIIKGTYIESPDATTLLEVKTNATGEIQRMHKSRSKLIRVGDLDFKSQYGEGYANQQLKDAEVVEHTTVAHPEFDQSPKKPPIAPKPKFATETEVTKL